MAVRRDIRDVLDLACGTDVIDDMEYQLLYNVNRVNRPSLEIPYWQYQHFDLDTMTDDECKVDFRFKKNDMHIHVDTQIWSPALHVHFQNYVLSPIT